MDAISFVVVFALLISVIAAYSFYEAQYIPDCWPDGRTDLRIPFGMLFLALLLTPLKGLGAVFLLAILVGTIPGMLYKVRKTRIARWSERPNKLSPAQHREADKLEFAFDKLLHRMGRKYSTLDPATDEGREELEVPARAKAKEYFALTGHDIEKHIDTWLGRRLAFKKIVDRDSITA